MKRFEDDRYYRTDDPALALIATRGTLAQWRSRGIGPPYIRYGNRILYLGADLNAWLDYHVVRPGIAHERDAHAAPPQFERHSVPPR